MSQSSQPGVKGDQWESLAVFFEVLDSDQLVCCGAGEGSSSLCHQTVVSEGVLSLGHGDCAIKWDRLPLWFSPGPWFQLVLLSP